MSLPSLGGGERGAGSVGGRRIVRGSLAAHRGYSNTSLTTHVSYTYIRTVLPQVAFVATINFMHYFSKLKIIEEILSTRH